MQRDFFRAYCLFVARVVSFAPERTEVFFQEHSTTSFRQCGSVLRATTSCMSTDGLGLDTNSISGHNNRHT
jgi:hypothetical protein